MRFPDKYLHDNDCHGELSQVECNPHRLHPLSEVIANHSTVTSALSVRVPRDWDYSIIFVRFCQRKKRAPWGSFHFVTSSFFIARSSPETDSGYMSTTCAILP